MSVADSADTGVITGTDVHPFEMLAMVRKARVGGPARKVLLSYVAERARVDGDGEWSAFPSQATLAVETEMSERSVRSILAAFEAEGLIRRERRVVDGRRSSDRIVLLLARIAAFSPPAQPAGEPVDQPAASLAGRTAEAPVHRQPAGGSTGKSGGGLPATWAADESQEDQEPSPSQREPNDTSDSGPGGGDGDISDQADPIAAEAKRRAKAMYEAKVDAGEDIRDHAGLKRWLLGQARAEVAAELAAAEASRRARLAGAANFGRLVLYDTHGPTLEAIVERECKDPDPEFSAALRSAMLGAAEAEAVRRAG